MEMDDLYLDVFIPPQMSQQRAIDHGLHANQDSRKHNLCKTGLREMQTDGCCKLITDESSVDIYDDLSMDTVYFEDPQHSPAKEEENLQKETLDKLVKELQDKVSELEKENKELRQSKEQVIVNISSLCLTARKVIQKKDEEISKLNRASEKRQQSSSAQASKCAQTQLYLTSEYVQTELHMASKYVQTVFQLASKAVQTPDDLQCLESSTDVCRIKLHEQLEKNGCSKESKSSMEKSNGQKILRTSSSQVCSTETSGAQVIGDKCEGKGKEKDGFSCFRTGPEKNVHVRDLRSWLNGKREQSTEKREQFFRTQANTADQKEQSCSPQADVHILAATSAPCKEQKMVSKQSTWNRKESLSGKRSLKTPEKKYRSEIRERLQREINLSVSLAECQGVASRNKTKMIANGKQCKMDQDNKVPYLKSKCVNQTASLDQGKYNVNTCSIQGKQTTLHSCFIKSPNLTSQPSLEMTNNHCAALSPDLYQINSKTNSGDGLECLAVCKEDLKRESRLHALASHQQGQTSDPSLHNTARITQNIKLHNSGKSHEKLLPVVSEDSEKGLPADKKWKRISNGMSYGAIEKSGTPNMLSKVVSSSFCVDASLSVADKADSDFDVTASSLPTDSLMKRPIRCSHHMCHGDNLVETVKTSGQAVQVNGSRTQSSKTKKNFDDSKNRDHNRQDYDSANELNFTVLTQDIDCDRNSNCSLEMITDKEKSLTLSSRRASAVDAVFVANCEEQKDADKTYKHAEPEQITHVTCTSNLILLGDEETSFGSPNKSQHFPTEFYPPGERGQVHDKGSHQRHIRGVPEIVCKEMVDKVLTFQNSFDRTPETHKSMKDESFDEMSAYTGNSQSDIKNGNQDYMKKNQSNTSSDCETHKVMSKMNMAPREVKNYEGQGGSVEADSQEKKILSFAASSLSTFRHREGLLTLQNKQIQGSAEHWMLAIKKTFREVFDKDISSFKKERASHLEPRLVHGLKKAKLLREFKKSRSIGGSKMKPRKISSADSQILSASFIVETTDDNKKCSVSPKLWKHLSNGQCKKAFSSNDSNQRPLSDGNFRHTNNGLETKTVLEQGNERKLHGQLSTELSNRDMTLFTSPTHQNSMWEPVHYEPDSTCDDQARAGQHWHLKGRETREKDEKIMKTQDRDHQWSIVPPVDADEISIASASLSEFDNDVVAAKTVFSPPSLASLCPEQEMECRDRFIKQKQSNTSLNTLKGDIIENSLQSHETFSVENVTKHCAMTPFTSEISEGETDSFHPQIQPKVTENNCLSRHMTWLQVQQLKTARKSIDIEWECPADKSKNMEQVKREESPSCEKHSDSGSLDTKISDAAYPSEQNFSSSHGSQNVGLNLHSNTEEAVLNGDLLSNTNHKLQLKLSQDKISCIETANEIRSVICSRESLKSVPKDEQVFSDIEEGEIQDDISVSSLGHVTNNSILNDDKTGQQDKKISYNQSSFKEITPHKAKHNSLEPVVCRRRQGSFKMRQRREFFPRPVIEPYSECDRDRDSFRTWTSQLYSKKFEKGKKRQRSPSIENFHTVKFVNSQNSSANETSQKHDLRHGDKQRRKELGRRNERKQRRSEDRQFEESRHQKCDRHGIIGDQRKERAGHMCEQKKRYGKKKRDMHTKETNLANRAVKRRPRANERKHSEDHKQTFGSTYNKSLENHKWPVSKESRSRMHNKDFMPFSVWSAASEYHVTDRQTVINHGSGISKKPENDSNSQTKSAKRSSHRNERCK